MKSVIVSNDEGQRELTFATIDLAKKIFKESYGHYILFRKR